MYQSLTMTVLITGALWCAAAPYAARLDRVVEADNPRMANQAVRSGSMADGAPFVDILTTNATMQYDEWMFTLDGTNNAAVVGVMTWTNLLGGYNGELPAVSPWTIGSVWLEVGDNLIVVAGTNLMGIAAADTVTVTRLPEPMPVIAITNATQVLPFGTTNTMIGGCYSNIVQVMWWSNDRDGEEHMIPAVGQAGWFAIAIANLQLQTNIITVRGWSQRERPAQDRTTIIVDWPWPFVDILTTNATVPFDDWLFTIDGTNNPAVVGGMVWTNLLGGGHGEFPAVSPWTIGSVMLEVGDNTIIVAGTNLAGIIAADTVTVTRLPEPMPVIAITNATQVLPAGTTNAMIGGCYSNIMEVLWWSNDRDGAEHMLNIEGQVGWFTAAISNLQTGTNTITVRGQSPHVRYAQDRTTIIVDWPWPFVAITNAPGLVAYELAEVTIAGTNANLAGAMAWQVNSGAPQWFARSGLNWSVTVTGLAHGWNTVTVYGTNEWARWTNATAQIYRQDILDIQPFVDILTTNATVPFDDLLCTIDGTNNTAVVGGMVWTNLVGGGHGEFPAVSPWTIGSVALEVGGNTIVVAGTNLAGIIAADTVTVTRLPEPLPVIAITNATQVLPAGTTSAMIGGCYSNILAALWWSNDRDGAEHMLPIAGQIGWFAAAITNLQTGTNTITVRGQSPHARYAQDRTTIIVDWPRPFVDILTTNATVPFDDSLCTIDGTNNTAVVGGMVWTNLLGGGHGEFPAVSPWTIGSVALAVGGNTIMVAGTNLMGIAAADTVTVTRLPEPLPVIAITNATQVLPAGTTNVMIGGCYSNIMEVLWWSNDRDGAEQMLPIAGQIGWFTAAITNLQPGTNTITVRGLSPHERPAHDSTTIIVDWARPFVDITNATPQVVDVPWVVVGGTNNADTYLVCCSNERTGYVQQPFAWNDVMANLIEGEQTLAVYGISAQGLWTADWHRVTYRILLPDIAISGPGGLITNGGMYDFGQVPTGVMQTASFWIDNMGAAPLTCQPVVVSSPGFAVVLQPQPVIAAGARSRFDIAVTPLATNVLTSTSSVANNVAAKNPYVIHLTATPVIPDGAGINHVWYYLARVNGSVRCRFHYNSAGTFSPGRDDIRLKINDTECLTDVTLADPYYWHDQHANLRYIFCNKVPASGRVVIMLDTRRQHGTLFVKKLLLPTCADEYLPVRLMLGSLTSVEMPWFAGATTGTREHFNTMGYRSNIFVVTGTRVRYRKSTPRADDVLTLQGRCMTNAAVVLPKTFTALFTWGICGSARTNSFPLTMQREPDNVCRSTDAGNVHATIGFARGRWQLRVGGLDLEQAAAAGPIVLHAALQLGTPLVVFDERTEYTATVLAKPSHNIVY